MNIHALVDDFGDLVLDYLIHASIATLFLMICYKMLQKLMKDE